MHWKTDDLMDEVLDCSEYVTGISNDGPGGDYDTDVLVITVKGTRQNLFVSGFNPGADGMEDPSDSEVELVTLTDGLDSMGGLNSIEKDVAMAYIEVRQYFIDKGARVVACMDDYY